VGKRAKVIGGVRKIPEVLSAKENRNPSGGSSFAFSIFSPISTRFFPIFSLLSLSAFSPLFSLCVCLSRAWTGILSDLMFGFAGTDEVEGDI